MEDDPKRPWKMIAGMVSAGLTTAITQGAEMNMWVSLTMACVVSALAVYLTPNPKV